ncbi:MAG TPA: DUF6655 family protein [Tepidisphaeraceae bacterium]|jgi:hypothetical protein|nr:DUF6655 family protein [Tepidisphaeraceae bacterium]
MNARPPLILLCLLLALGAATRGCATIRTTDPPRTATEQFLIRQAAITSIAQLSFDALRDRPVYVETTYLSAVDNPSTDISFLLGEMRARILTAGARIANVREDAQIILEVRSPGLGIDRVEFLLGIPGLYLNGGTSNVGVPVATPELSIIKSTKQYGYASVAFVAYWKDTGELVYQSGPFVGRTRREDWWFFGIGPRTTGDIPTVEKER